MKTKPVAKKVAKAKTAASGSSAARPALRVGIKQLDHARGLPLPAYQSLGAAGLDLVAAIPENETVSIPPGERRLLPTGLVMEIPEGFEGQVRPRSGIALKHGITVLNTPGTIDADYRGEIGVILFNSGSAPFPVARGERIAQIVIAPVTQAVLVAVDAVSQSDRGAGGFGSTGAFAGRSPDGNKPKRTGKSRTAGMKSAKTPASAKKAKAKAKPGKKQGKSDKAPRKAN